MVHSYQLFFRHKGNEKKRNTHKFFRIKEKKMQKSKKISSKIWIYKKKYLLLQSKYVQQ